MVKKPQRTDAQRRARQCERLGRLLRTLHLIAGKGRWDADGLAQELECSRRTVYRLLAALSSAGIPWYYDETIRSYRVRPGFRFPMIEGTTQPAKPNKIVSQELEPLLDKFIADGEQFVTSLRKFLDALTLLRNSE